MRALRAWVLRAGGLFRRQRDYSEFEQEVESHLGMHVEDNLRAGMTLEEARRDALIRFGGVENVAEIYGERRGLPALDTLAQDVRYGCRMLWKSRGLTAIVALTLALGISANTAIFSVLNGWLLRPLPVRAPEQITVLASVQPERRNPSFSFLDLLDYQKQAGAFSDLFAYGTGLGGITVDGKPSQFITQDVTGNYFSALGVKPALGRLFLPGEGESPGSEPQVVLGYAYWQKRFGGDRGIAGKQVLVNGKPATILGVAQQEFHGTFFAVEMDGYLPLSMLAPDHASAFWTDRRERTLTVMGRLKPGISLNEAQSLTSVVAGRLADQFPSTNKGITVRVIPERLARPAALVASFAPIIASLFLVLAAMVLLLACLNVANILLARATSRQREMAIRAALGAARGRLIRQMLTESLLLALIGAIGGVVIGEWAISAGASMLHSVTTNSSNIGFRMDTSFDWKVFAYTMAAAVFTGIFAGVWPAFRAGRTDVSKALHSGGRSDSAGAGRQGVRSALVVAQVAGSLMLLIVAGLFVRSLGQAERMNLGFDPDHVLNVMMEPATIGYDETRAKTFYRELEERVRALPGVQSVSLSYAVPLGFPGKGAPIFVEGQAVPRDQQAPVISYNNIDAGYFDTMRVPLLRGRGFTDADKETARPVAIVNEKMARKLWPGADPVGKRFSIKSAAGPFLEVVGLARDGQYLFLSPETQPYFYVPLAQNYTSFRSMQVRSSVPPESLIPGVQEKIRGLAPDMPVMDISPMEKIVHGLGGLFIFRLAASLAALLGALGLALAVMGVYGVVSYSVSQRTNEIGIRMALGAGRGEILKLVSRQGLRLVTIGIVAGLAAAAALTRAMSKLLIGVSPTDPTTYALVAIVLCGVTVLACWIPARRALRVDPMVALRDE